MSDYEEDFEDQTPRGNDKQADRLPTIKTVNIPKGAEMTPENLTVYGDLKKENAALRKQLIELNRQLDEKIGLEGQKMQRAPQVASHHSTPIERYMSKNEDQRRVNNELTDRIHQYGSLDRCQEINNLLGDVTIQVNLVKDENRSLDNVYSNQMVKMGVWKKFDEDIRVAREKHQAEMREIREQVRESKERRDTEVGQVRALTKQLERIEEKLKVQESVGSTVRSVKDIEEQCAEQDRIIDTLKYQVAVLSKTNISDKKRVKQRQDKLQKELVTLRANAATLREGRPIAEAVGDEEDF